MPKPATNVGPPGRPSGLRRLGLLALGVSAVVTLVRAHEPAGGARERVFAFLKTKLSSESP